MDSKRMIDRAKISLEDLATINGEMEVDISAVTGANNATHSLIVDEIEEFISKPVKREKPKKNQFFETRGVDTKLRNAIKDILNVRNAKEIVMKRQAQYDFDRKMARIRKIKSKTYRRMKRRDKQRKDELDVDGDAEDLSDGLSTSDESGEELLPVISFENKKESESEVAEEVQVEVKEAFETPGFEGNEVDFMMEKERVAKEDSPQVLEHGLPGWGDWAGEDIEFQKKSYNTIVEKKDGVRRQDRQDYGKSHLIINEHVTANDKYKCKLPYGYTKKDYMKKLETPISSEAMSLRIFNRLVKKEEKTVLGQNIKPTEFDPEY